MNNKNIKVLIVGNKGMLGTDLQKQLSKKFEVVGVDNDVIDITKLDNTVQHISEVNPDVVINCAAYTNVDACEENVDLAYNVNGVGVRNLAIASNKVNAKLVQISTDYVFDGEGDTDLREYDIPNPISVYGKSKYMGEEMIKSFSNKYFIIRTQWLYGINGNNFVKTMLKLAETNDTLKVVHDQIGSPTYTVDLCKFIEQLITTEQYGIYHGSNEGRVSWCEFAQKIFELTNTKTTVNPCTTDEFPRPAHRPKYSVMDKSMLRMNGFDDFRNYEDALIEYLKEEKYI